MNILFAGLCRALPNPPNGRVMWTGLTDGSVAIYTCNNGYQEIGERLRTCLSNLMWSGEEPTCTRMNLLSHV